MQRAIDLARETNASGLVLSTSIDNSSSQGLYESLGFTRDQDFYHYYLNFK